MRDLIQAVTNAQHVPRRGEWIRNPQSRERLRFTVHADETEGRFCRFDFVAEAGGGGVPFVHYHRYQTEVFRMKEGEVLLNVGGEERVLRAGDEVSLPPGTPHSLVNNGETDAVMEVEYHPALHSEWWLSTVHGAAERSGRDPGILELIPHMVVKDIGVVPVGVPRWVLVAIGWALYPIARLTGRWTRMAELALSPAEA